MSAKSITNEDDQEKYFLGIDIGGSNVKMGLVDKNGVITGRKKVSTHSLRNAEDFVEALLQVIAEELEDYPQVSKVGIGVPGMLSKDRSITLEIPAIPELDNVNLLEALRNRFPGKTFLLENDANAAALGELYFAKKGAQPPDNFIFITLGTGIGGAAIIDGDIFKGGGGNGMELGHILSVNNQGLEKLIGKQGIIDLANTLKQKYGGNTLLSMAGLSTKEIVVAANKNDGLACEILERVGEILGEALVTAIRILDVKDVIVGGGLSTSFDLIIDSIMEVLNNYLTPYYTSEINIRRASLANNAGIIGAASLCFK